MKYLVKILLIGLIGMMLGSCSVVAPEYERICVGQYSISNKLTRKSIREFYDKADIYDNSFTIISYDVSYVWSYLYLGGNPRGVIVTFFYDNGNKRIDKVLIFDSSDAIFNQNWLSKFNAGADKQYGIVFDEEEDFGGLACFDGPYFAVILNKPIVKHRIKYNFMFCPGNLTDQVEYFKGRDEFLYGLGMTMKNYVWKVVP